jgi:hypothetical protein
MLAERLSSMLAERSKIDEGKLALDTKFEELMAEARRDSRSELTAEETATIEAMKAERAALVKRREVLDQDIAEAEQRHSDIVAARKDSDDAADKIKRFNIQRPSSVNGGVRGSDHTLDELLWATASEVRAGSLDNIGNVVPHLNARASVERVEVRNADKQPVLAPRINEFTEARAVAIRNFQQTVADMQVFGMLIDKRATTGSEGFMVAREHPAFKDQYKRVLRAMDTDTSNEGVDWIPTGIGSSLHERVRASGKVAPLFQRINLPTNPWKWPLEGADATAYRVAEPTSDTATKVTVSTPGTGAATFDAEIFGGRVLFSKSLEADSALAILPYVQRKLVQAFVDAEERAILDGDTDGTHQDSDTNSAGATDAAWAWDGLRKRALANSSASGGSALTVALLAARRADMDYYGLNPAEMAFIVPISSYYALVTDTNVITVDKFGPQATILNGQLGSLYGVPIIVSEHVRTNLNASGIHDAITTTKTYALAVNRNEWVMGQRTPLALETDDSLYRETYQRVVVGFMRQDFQNVNARGTSEDDTSIVYNVTP